jgi:hypothetical protein
MPLQVLLRCLILFKLIFPVKEPLQDLCIHWLGTVMIKACFLRAFFIAVLAPPCQCN